MKIVIIGSGNIATFFSKKIFLGGHEIVQVVSATDEHAQELAQHFKCDSTSHLSNINHDADIYLLAVKDDIVSDIIQQINFNQKIVIHTAGSLNLSHIANASANIGSIWCMYSINKNHLPDRENIPLIINASNTETLNIIQTLSTCISTAIFSLTDDQKLKAHLAAVFANNFANHMFTIGQDILQSEEIPFELLIPLIENTVEKLNYTTPNKLQTGPAIRNDELTIAKHLQLLENEIDTKKIYTLLTSAIQKKYGC